MKKAISNLSSIEMEKFFDYVLSVVRTIVHAFFDRVIIGKLFHSGRKPPITKDYFIDSNRREQTDGNRFNFFCSFYHFSSPPSFRLKIYSERLLDTGYANNEDRGNSEEHDQFAICSRIQTNPDYLAREKFVLEGDCRSLSYILFYFRFSVKRG